MLSYLPGSFPHQHFWDFLNALSNLSQSWDNSAYETIHLILECCHILTHFCFPLLNERHWCWVSVSFSTQSILGIRLFFLFFFSKKDPDLRSLCNSFFSVIRCCLDLLLPLCKYKKYPEWCANSYHASASSTEQWMRAHSNHTCLSVFAHGHPSSTAWKTISWGHSQPQRMILSESEHMHCI